MPQLHLYVPDGIAKVLRQRARARGLTVSRYLAEIVRRDLGHGWPADFFDLVVGGWVGERLERPAQGEYEVRRSL